MDGDASDIVTEQFDFSGVQSSTDFDPELSDRIADVAGAANRARWAVENRDKRIADRIDFASAEPGKLLPNQNVVLLKELQPGPITTVHHSLGRANNIREEHRREHAIRLAGWFVSGQDFLDFVDDLVAILCPPRVIHAMELDKTRPWDVLGQVRQYYVNRM
jgi:hypothetical protein